MTTVHIAQRHDFMREALATAFKDAGYDVRTYDTDSTAPLQAALAMSKEPSVVVTGQVGECSLTFGNHAALVAKMSGQPTLTFVYSVMLPDAGSSYLENTDKDEVVLQRKGVLRADIADMKGRIQTFVQKHGL